MSGLDLSLLVPERSGLVLIGFLSGLDWFSLVCERSGLVFIGS